MADDDAYSYPQPLNNGLRLSLWDVESQSTKKKVDILRLPPKSPTATLGGYNKPEMKSRQNEKISATFPYPQVDYSTDQPILGQSDRKEWALNSDRMDTYAKYFGISEEELQSGKYKILLEPLIEIHMSSSTATVIGTPTEIAAYYMTLTNNGTDQQRRKIIIDNLGALINSQAPKHYFMLKDDMNVGYSGVVDSKDYIPSVEQLAGGWGIGIISPKDMGEQAPPTSPLSGNMIMKDELNRPFNQSGSASPGGLDGVYSWSVGNNTTNNFNYLAEPSTGSSFTAHTNNKFIGDRSFTSPETKLKIK